MNQEKNREFDLADLVLDTKNRVDVDMKKVFTMFLEGWKIADIARHYDVDSVHLRKKMVEVAGTGRLLKWRKKRVGAAMVRPEVPVPKKFQPSKILQVVKCLTDTDTPYSQVANDNQVSREYVGQIAEQMRLSKIRVMPRLSPNVVRGFTRDQT